MDLSILKNRLSATIEYYKTKTDNLLMSVSLPPTTGVGSVTQNVGKSENTGMEFAVNGTIINNPNGLTWDASVNIYFNRNKLVALASGATQDRNNNWFVGSPINVIWDYKAVGIWQQGDPYLTNYEPGGQVGMIKVQYSGTYNADGSPTKAVSDDDKVIMNQDPNFQGGFNTRVGYKGLDLTVTGTFQNGGILIATPYGSSGYLNLLSGRRGNIKVDYWTPTNTGAKFPVPNGPGVDQPTHLNSLSYIDGSYLKVQAITLGYNFKQKFIKAAGIDNMRIYIQVVNPFIMFSPYYKMSGMDPQPNSYGNENAAVPMTANLKRLLTVGNNTPTTRNYLIGLNFTF